MTNPLKTETRRITKKINTLEGALKIIRNKTVKVIILEKIIAYKDCLESLNKIIGALK